MNDDNIIFLVDEHTPNNPYGQNKCTSSGQSDFSEFISGCSTLWWNEVEQWPNTSNTTLTDANWEPVGHWSQVSQGFLSFYKISLIFRWLGPPPNKLGAR